MNTENLSTLKIHKLTQAQYEREMKAGRIDENAIYLTPDEEDAVKEGDFLTFKEQVELEFDDCLKKEPRTYTATPDTLIDIINSAENGATIQLEAGTYPLLTLTNQYGLTRKNLNGYIALEYNNGIKDADGTLIEKALITTYPENLTIRGQEGVFFEGVSLTSGVLSHERTLTDLTVSTLPGGLVFENINFTKSACLRNAQIDGLSFIGCNVSGGNICIKASGYSDTHGGDYWQSATATDRKSFMAVRAKNVIIKNCTINAKGLSEKNTSAIYLSCVDGATVDTNTIVGADYNGVQVTGVIGSSINSTGKIIISGNNIQNTSNRAIRIAYLEDADLNVIMNSITNQSVASVYGYVYVSNCINTSTFFGKAGSTSGDNGTLNLYDNSIIDIDSGIIFKVTKTELQNHIDNIDNPHKVTREQLGAASQEEIGDIKEILGITNTGVDDDCYIDKDGTSQSQESCRVYHYTYNEDEMSSKTIKIKTYMYGDMAITAYDDTGFGWIGLTNSQADIEANPESGIFEIEIEVGVSSGGDIHVSFCENPYLDAPEVYIKPGTIWQEIKKVSDKTSVLSTGIGALTGYGIGESVGRHCYDCYSVTKGGLYYIDANTLNSPIAGSASLLVQPIWTTSGIDIYLTLKSGANIVHCYYSSFAKAWQPWEWENPPLVAWKEYRTIDRYNNRPVYTKVFGIGTISGTGVREIGHGAQTVKDMLRITATTAYGETIPNDSTSIYATKQHAYISKTSDITLTNINAQIWYTKTTD